MLFDYFHKSIKKRQICDNEKLDKIKKAQNEIERNHARAKFTDLFTNLLLVKDNCSNSINLKYSSSFKLCYIFIFSNILEKTGKKFHFGFMASYNKWLSPLFTLTKPLNIYNIL